MKRLLFQRLRTFVFSLGEIAAECRDKTADIAKIRASMLYLRMLDSLRSIIRAVIGVLSGIALAAVGLITLHAVVLFLLPVSVEVRVVMGAFLGFADLGIAFALYHWAFSDDTWIKSSLVDELLEEVIESKYDPFSERESKRSTYKEGV